MPEEGVTVPRAGAGSVAVIIAKLGPYHAARMVALGALLGPESVLVLEVAQESREYTWERVATSGFRRRTLVTSEYEAVSGHALKKIMYSALEEEQPEAVAINGWGFPEARAALAWCRSRARIAVLMSDSQERDLPRLLFKETAKRAILRDVDAALVGGSRHVDYLEQLGFDRERAVTGYDVVDNSYFQQGADRARADLGLRQRTGLPERYFVVPSRFVPKKNLIKLLEAFAMYRRQLGADAWDSRDHRGRAGASSHRGSPQGAGARGIVQLIGFKQYPDLPTYYGLASGFILPSTSDQWGLVVNEAMAVGLPVLVSHACGASELVRDGESGFRFDPLSSADMARAMADLTREGPHLAEMGQAARNAAARLSPESFAKALSKAVALGKAHRSIRPRSLLPNLALWF